MVSGREDPSVTVPLGLSFLIPNVSDAGCITANPNIKFALTLTALTALTGPEILSFKERSIRPVATNHILF
jgi:hypothetical protein